MGPDIHWRIGEGTEQAAVIKSAPPRRSRRSWTAALLVVMLGAGLGVPFAEFDQKWPAWLQ
jgi:hypothetical protein